MRHFLAGLTVATALSSLAACARGVLLGPIGLLLVALLGACREATGPGVTAAGTWSSLTARGYQTCGLTPAGVAYCWGDNTNGQLGDGTTSSRPTPVAVAGALKFASLVQGDLQTCGLTVEGAAYCWGDNYYGELGLGFADYMSVPHPIPAPVVGGLKFTSLVADYFHACGLTAGGAAYCWGYNGYGQLGDGSTTDRFNPVAVAGSLTFTALTAGDRFTCGLTTGGNAYCWGDNEFGAFGRGSTQSSATPVMAAGGLTFTRLSAGWGHVCGLTSGGVAYCWGANVNGELGDGSTDSATSNVRTDPVLVAGGLSFTTITAGPYHTCGTTLGGAAYCWGENTQGEVGDGTMSRSRTEPVAVAGGLRFMSLAAGLDHTCGVTSGGDAYCWGGDDKGELGDGSTGPPASMAAVPVAGGLSFTALAAGYYHTCGIARGGAAYCWGLARDGELGNDSTTDRAAPVAVAGGLSFVSLSAGGDQTCGVTTNGSAYCWGSNAFGQLGDGSASGHTTPSPVAGGLSFRSVAAGYWYTCGLATTGAAYCWGTDGMSQLGDSAHADQDAPVPVKGGLSFVSLTAGGEHACGVTGNGVAYCWGANNAGQLGDSTKDTLTFPPTQTFTHTPVAVAGGLTFANLTGGWDHTCGVTTNDAAYCWGENLVGELGNGSYVWSDTPVAVAGAMSFASLTGGNQRTCGVTTGGAAYCWGATYSQTPTAVASGLTLASVTLGDGHACGLTNAGAAYCWGSNENGQLGNGGRVWHLTPVAVVNP